MSSGGGAVERAHIRRDDDEIQKEAREPPLQRTLNGRCAQITLDCLDRAFGSLLTRLGTTVKIKSARVRVLYGYHVRAERSCAGC
jgi:hypothetical protein